MKILVTGNAGFIGSTKIRYIIAKTTDCAVNVKGHDQSYPIDAGRVELNPGWRPQETLECGSRKTAKWYLVNQVCCQRMLDGSD